MVKTMIFAVSCLELQTKTEKGFFYINYLYGQISNPWKCWIITWWVVI